MNSSSSQIEQFYQVSKIIGKRNNQANGQVEYLVKWKGWKQPTWQPQTNLTDVPDSIYEFQQTLIPKQKISKADNKRASETGKFSRLKKLSAIQSENKQNVSVSTSFSQGFNDKKAQECIQRSSKRIADNKEKSYSKSPNIKFTKDYTNNQEQARRRQNEQLGCINFNSVQKVLNIQKRDGNWIVQVKFEQQRLQNGWVQRDILRLMYPKQLLYFYQKQVKSKGISVE